MKKCNLILIPMVYIILTWNNLNAQLQIPYRNFELKKENQEKYYSKPGRTFRKDDNVLTQAIQLDLALPGNSLIEKSTKYLKNNWTFFGHYAEMDQTLKSDCNDETNKIIRFKQYYKGIPVDNFHINLAFDKKDKLGSVSNSTRPIKINISISPNISKPQILKALNKHFHGNVVKNLNTELIIHFYGKEPKLSYQCNFETDKPRGSWCGFIDAKNGKVLEVLNNILFVDKVNGRGKIFNPDPISTSHGTYGQGGLSDNNNGNNSELEAQESIVDLIGINHFGNDYILTGDNAEIFDDSSPFDQLFIQNSSDFYFTRNQLGFEAVMCYYFIDKTIKYAKSIFPFSGAVRYDPHSESRVFSSEYLSGDIHMADGGNGANNGPNVDHGEDAMMIIHESGHFIHHKLVGFNGSGINLNGSEGVSEGFGDYWAGSEVNALKQYKDYEEGYYRVFRWANWNPGSDPNFFTNKTTNRTLNTDILYPPPSGISPHYTGQIFSTVLTKIYNDIGKTNSDKIVLKGLALAGTPAPKQPMVADQIYQAAIMEGLELWELCIIWNHFNETYNTPENINGPFFTATKPQGSSDLYMRDDIDDLGLESNQTSQDMWLSEDIWVRPTDDGKPYHDNPEYRKNSLDKTNFVYVRIRGRGCSPVSDATLHIYWSKASTGLSWPTNWQYSEDVNHKQISGEIGQVNLASLNIQSGEERTIKLPWIPPNPEDFDDEGKQHYCLYGRIVSSDDPMHCTEVSNPNNNARCNNNIAWKNITVISVPGFTKDTGIIFIRDIFSSGSGPSCLTMRDADLPHFNPTLNNADITFRLREPLRSIWIAGGLQGSGYSYDSESGLFTINSFPVTLCNLNLQSMQNYLMDIYVTGNGNTAPFAFDLKHYKMTVAGGTIGGERFIYPGVGTEALPRTKNNNIKKDELATVYPNPFKDIIYLKMNKNISNATMNFYSPSGLKLKTIYYDSKLRNEVKIDFENISYFGVIFLQVKTQNENQIIKLLKL